MAEHAEQIEADVRCEDCREAATAVVAPQDAAGLPDANVRMRLCGPCTLGRVDAGQRLVLVQALPPLTIKAKETPDGKD